MSNENNPPILPSFIEFVSAVYHRREQDLKKSYADSSTVTGEVSPYTYHTHEQRTTLYNQPPPPLPSYTDNVVTFGCTETPDDTPSLPVHNTPKKKIHQFRSHVTTMSYVYRWCHWCGTARTPEWRRGPEGKGTLCNACGLYFAKVEKECKEKCKKDKRRASKRMRVTEGERETKLNH